TAGWTNGAPIPRRLVLNDGETDWAVTLSGRGNAFTVHIGEVQHEVEVLDMAGREASLILDRIRQRMAFVLNGDDIHLSGAGQNLSLTDITYAPVAGDDAEGNGQIIAQTEGLVVGIAVTEGVQVDKGDTLVTVEAMKMEHHHVADGSGRVRAISVADGDQVKKGQMLVELELDATQEATS
ncbi:MAG: biotin/lipoyl-binding protein, partial [Rhodobacteraceae bacterium]|nr:biotin/lipoyl-binding protein [Paracoccaceae bacterium]